MFRKISVLKKNWFNYPDFIRFLIIGCINAGISYLIFVAAVLILGTEHYRFCTFLQWVISSVISYLNQKFLVFGTRGNYINEYLKCCSTWCIGYVFNLIILEIFVRFVFKNVFISQFISMALVSCLTYLLFKLFAFKQK